MPKELEKLSEAYGVQIIDTYPELRFQVVDHLKLIAKSGFDSDMVYHVTTEKIRTVNQGTQTRFYYSNGGVRKIESVLEDFIRQALNIINKSKSCLK